MTPASEELLTRDDVAKWLHVKPRQVERLRDIPCVDLGRKTKRYRRQDVEGWIASKLKRRPAA